MCMWHSISEHATAIFFPLTYKKTDEKTSNIFKLNNMSVLTTRVDFVHQIPNGHLSLIDSSWGSVKILKKKISQRV